MAIHGSSVTRPIISKLDSSVLEADGFFASALEGPDNLIDSAEALQERGRCSDNKEILLIRRRCITQKAIEEISENCSRYNPEDLSHSFNSWIPLQRTIDRNGLPHAHLDRILFVSLAPSECPFGFFSKTVFARSFLLVLQDPSTPTILHEKFDRAVTSYQQDENPQHLIDNLSMFRSGNHLSPEQTQAFARLLLQKMIEGGGAQAFPLDEDGYGAISFPEGSLHARWILKIWSDLVPAAYVQYR